MSARKEHIVRYTVEELREMERRGEVGSDWQRAATIPLPDGSDPDDAMEPVEMDRVTTELPEPLRRRLSRHVRADSK